MSPTGVLRVLQRRAGRAHGASPGCWTSSIEVKPDIISVTIGQERDSWQVLGIVGN